MVYTGNQIQGFLFCRGRRNPGRERVHLGLVLGRMPVRGLKNKANKYHVFGSILDLPLLPNRVNHSECSKYQQQGNIDTFSKTYPTWHGSVGTCRTTVLGGHRRGARKEAVRRPLLVFNSCTYDQKVSTTVFTTVVLGSSIFLSDHEPQGSPTGKVIGESRSQRLQPGSSPGRK